jgi:hypothetical protein
MRVAKSNSVRVAEFADEAALTGKAALEAGGPHGRARLFVHELILEEYGLARLTGLEGTDQYGGATGVTARCVGRPSGGEEW